MLQLFVARNMSTGVTLGPQVPAGEQPLEDYSSHGEHVSLIEPALYMGQSCPPQLGTDAHGPAQETRYGASALGNHVQRPQEQIHHHQNHQEDGLPETTTGLQKGSVAEIISPSDLQAASKGVVVS